MFPIEYFFPFPIMCHMKNCNKIAVETVEAKNKCREHADARNAQLARVVDVPENVKRNIAP